MTDVAKARWQLHFCVLLWAFTAILGKLISLDAVKLVWWRLLIVVACLFVLPGVWRALRRTPRRLVAIFAGIGVLVTLHWLTFYGAIKLANASVAVTCLAVAPAFLSVIEPWIAQRPFDWRELALGLAVVPGVVLVVGGVPDDMRLGVLVGITSALFVAFFIALNKRHAERADSLLVTGLELGAGLVLIAAAAPFLPGGFASLMVPPAGLDVLWIGVLALACTLLPFTLSLVALRRISAFGAQLTINLEPIYTIVFAALIFNEQRELGPRFYLGVLVVLSAVFLHPLLARRPELIAPDAIASDTTDAVADKAGASQVCALEPDRKG
ncbi:MULTISPECIES: DMT family transporter [Hydrocarboniphaga]|uniref:Integral membrane protein DUF6 n=1 Tax=Hydrocarboniphaga effusa AP103 TaxID=1172194 RepID=I8TEQ6_9GAMM|nr:MULTISPECIES: DMT family transporter [Hydrocarboniphaga]EIT72208.1 Integral membrane protein DUF6 [Hydrocarboniphaga effusa AP103]MDZ4079657.1 DMT family transporter [Hydrocarboniphaga sp.]